MRALIIMENGKFVEKEIYNLEGMQESVGGNIELVVITENGMEVYCNEYSKFGCKFNPIASGIIEEILGFGLAGGIYGNLLFWRETGISDEDITIINKWFEDYFNHLLEKAN